MLRRLFALLLLAVLLAPAAVLAGGWVVISLDTLPGKVRVGEPLTVGFMVRQHGQTPISGVSPMLHARNAESGEEISVAAVQEGEIGHFVATVTFPSEGEWTWSIGAPPFPQEWQFAPLTVLPATAVTESERVAQATWATPELLRWSALALFASAVALAGLSLRQRRATAVAPAGD